MDARSALPALATVVALLAATLTTISAAQSSRPEPPTTAPRLGAGPGPTTAPYRDAGESDRTMHRARPPLLREGSQLVQVQGTVRRDDVDGTWTFTIDAAGAAAPHYDLTLMPSSLLGEMEQMIDASAGNHLVFEMTGQVYVYRERNYLMPTHPPLLVRHEPAPRRSTSDPGAGRRSGATADAGGKDTTADIIRDLEQSIGSVARRGAAEHRAPFGTLGSSTTGGGASLEGTMLVQRRGVIRRTGAGAYILIFDADAEGNADPPMRLLPCMALQSLENHARQHGERAAVLVSGHVYTYRGINYLRPTLFRIPRDRTRLQP